MKIYLEFYYMKTSCIVVEPSISLFREEMIAKTNMKLWKGELEKKVQSFETVSKFELIL